MDQTYRIFTDGSAIGNPGPGGWGVVVIQGKERWEMSGADPWTTISEMELVAAVQALRSVEGRARIELYSDSEYLIYGMRAFVSRWQRQGWRNRRGTQLQDRELWSELIELDTRLAIRWKWVKGHSGHRDQSRADELAYEAARSLCVLQKVPTISIVHSSASAQRDRVQLVRLTHWKRVTARSSTLLQTPP